MDEEKLLSRKDTDALGYIYDGFKKGDVSSFVCVCVKADGSTEVFYDLHHIKSVKLMNKMGGGLIAALQAIRDLAVEAKIESNILKGRNPFAVH